MCSIYFRNLLKKNGIDFDTFEFTEKEQILIDYGQAIAENPKHVPQELFDKLKANFTEEEIVVITAMGVMMIANNYFNDILGVTPDKLVDNKKEPAHVGSKGSALQLRHDPCAEGR